MTSYRVGIIGLRPQDPGVLSAGIWGIKHLKALQASPNFTVTAVCNSTLASSQRSIESHGLGGAKAHATADELAADPNVDLVVIAVFVDRHFELMKPALLHKKHVYVEFPVGVSVEEVRELSTLAKEAGVRVVVGAQATADPLFQTVERLVTDKALGDVVLSSFTGSLPWSVSDGVPDSMQPFLDFESPISRSKGQLGHYLAPQVHILGCLKSVQSVFKTVEKAATTLDDKGQVVQTGRKVTAPDTMLVQGVLESDALFSFSLRASRTTVGDVGFRWLLAGTEGEVEITATSAIPQFGDLKPKIMLRKWKQDEVEISVDEVEGQEDEWLRQLPSPTTNIARAYDHFSKGEEGGYVTLTEGLKVHELLAKVHESVVWAP